MQDLKNRILSLYDLSDSQKYLISKDFEFAFSNEELHIKIAYTEGQISEISKTKQTAKEYYQKKYDTRGSKEIKEG